MKRLLGALGFSTLLVASTVFAHHGWSEYDSSKPLQLNGTIEESGYSHPHGFIRLKTDDKTWSVVLAPPSRMENRGLSREMLSVGKRATVVGYQNRNNPDELRAERITVDNKTTELR
ncbi:MULTISPECIES: DUF6152 family protein [Pseudomonas]|jgi:hypothetical protein|uniref:DUF5666 domain-containing protein n=2 Tax=Pseudomonas fluorescens group TaxID=136843 RepID=A0AB36D2C2_9PSED|nr:MULTISPECIES: DUF6152 family protein [Pseudomonas]MBU0522466.1 hypothetical protein [Gammaproteobacteria bacterium]MBU0819192.1 hypothetical protein [Gammaproteobacteria bacterium]MBU0842553.1 hypothetical protein [Gammaproteobacteria bacterium]MBU1840951.1 hypothetical protein [Gammaproteobacteria bacterium]MDO8709187.1 DUF6152 family protein [Pseudomonas sp.]